MWFFNEHKERDSMEIFSENLFRSGAVSYACGFFWKMLNVYFDGKKFISLNHIFSRTSFRYFFQLLTRSSKKPIFVFFSYFVKRSFTIPGIKMSQNWSISQSTFHCNVELQRFSGIGFRDFLDDFHSLLTFSYNFFNVEKN
jgi:hypothetical protein